MNTNSSGQLVCGEVKSGQLERTRFPTKAETIHLTSDMREIDHEISSKISEALLSVQGWVGDTLLHI